MVTYDGRAFIGVSTDDRAVPDVTAFARCLRDGFSEVTGVECGPLDRFAAPDQRSSVDDSPAQ